MCESDSEVEQPTKILIVDDSWDDRYVLKRALRKTGLPLAVFEAEDGTDAISFLSHEGPFADPETCPDPDVIFLDLKMPGRNGFDVLRWLQQHPPRQPVRVFALSGSEAEIDVRTALDLGAELYMLKPPTPAQLRDLLSMVTNCSRTQEKH